MMQDSIDFEHSEVVPYDVYPYLIRYGPFRHY